MADSATSNKKLLYKEVSSGLNTLTTAEKIQTINSIKNWFWFHEHVKDYNFK